MCGVSNQIIEEAMKAVKAECSLENIRHLAETIKKYRPAETELNNSHSLN